MTAVPAPDTPDVPATADSVERPRVFLHRGFDLEPIDRCAARRQYRTLRIAMYAPSSSGYPLDNGYYGLSRDEAKTLILNFYREVSWLTYVGSK